MQSTFTLRKYELNMDFLKGLKKMFSGKTLNMLILQHPHRNFLIFL